VRPTRTPELTGLFDEALDGEVLQKIESGAPPKTRPT
jgi:hypothetical protein